MIKVQCVLYQWISSDKLYKLIGSFFQFGNHFRITGRAAKNIKKDREESILIKILQLKKYIYKRWVFVHALRESIHADKHAL